MFKNNFKNITIRKAVLNDAFAIANITFKRGKTKKKLEEHIERTKNEFKKINHATSFNMLVAEDHGDIIGFCRSIYADSKEIKISRYCNASVGWYLMGTIIDKEFRRQGIGQKLTILSLDEIKKKSKEVFVLINAENFISIRMHEQLGFEIISEGEGFMNVDFSGGKGYLLRKIL